MDRTTFEAIDPQTDKIADIVDRVLESDELADLRRALADLTKTLGNRYSASLDVTLNICDREREQAIPVLRMGLASSEGEEPYKATGDSSAQKYIVDGNMQIVPHDYCPRCWEPWDFKFEHRTCQCCGATLGEDVKVLLDSDVCPHCERGKVTATSPKCGECGYVVDLSVVTWG